MKKLLIHLVTFAMGTGAGFLLAQKLLDKKYAKLAQDEIDDVKKTYNQMREEFLRETRVPDPSVNVKSEKKSKKSNSSLNLTRMNPYEESKRNYNILSKSEEVVATILDEQPIREVDRTKPYLISDTEFSEDYDHHDKVSLYYYKKDGVLSEEAEDIVDNVEGTVGIENLNALDKNISIWVRNEALAIDFEIIGINKSYSEAVHGIVEESPKERHKRVSTKKAKKNEQ